jgi:predicted Zn-dependent protease with MMP-like domain
MENIAVIVEPEPGAHQLARSPEHLPKLVEDTIWHEVAHYFGMDEAQVRAAERARNRLQ